MFRLMALTKCLTNKVIWQQHFIIRKIKDKPWLEKA